MKTKTSKINPVCADDDCANPRNGSLNAFDYPSRAKPRDVCKHCRVRKHGIKLKTTSSRFDGHEASALGLDMRLAQKFLCARW